MIKKNYINAIICPECKKKQIASVLDTVPFLTKVHSCIKCKYIIMESEWEELTETEAHNLVTEFNKNSLRTFVKDINFLVGFFNYVMVNYRPTVRTYRQLMQLFINYKKIMDGTGK